MEVSTPTELQQLLQKDTAAQKIYSRLSDSAKRYYAAYVIAAQTVHDRKCRAKHALQMLLGQANTTTVQC